MPLAGDTGRKTCARTSNKLQAYGDVNFKLMLHMSFLFFPACKPLTGDAKCNISFGFISSIYLVKIPWKTLEGGAKT